MKKIKNKFLTLFFAAIPGCGHMYLGYMKKGVQFMLMFAIFAFLGWVAAVNIVSQTLLLFFVIILPIIWFYQMFDAMHTISQMRLLEITFPEDDGFFVPGFSNITNLDSLDFFKKPGVVKSIAIVLLCVGVYVFFMNMAEVIFNALRYNTASGRLKEFYRDTYYAITRYTPSVIISVLLIFGGIKLLWGNRKNKGKKQDSELSDLFAANINDENDENDGK